MTKTVTGPESPSCVNCGKTIDWYAPVHGQWIWFEHEEEPTTAICEACLASAASDDVGDKTARQETEAFFWEVQSFEPKPGGLRAAVVSGVTAEEALLAALRRCRDAEDAAHVLANELLVRPLGIAFEKSLRDANTVGGVVCVEYAEGGE